MTVGTPSSAITAGRHAGDVTLTLFVETLIPEAQTIVVGIIGPVPTAGSQRSATLAGGLADFACSRLRTRTSRIGTNKIKDFAGTILECV